MDAIILAGGLGTRLRSVVSDVPKCMASVAGKPFLHYILKYLKREKIDRVILSLGYKHEIVEEWIKNEKYDFDFVYSVEDVPLGTGGAIKLAMSYAKSEQVLILNGDTFFDVDIDAFKNAHLASKAMLNIALKPMSNFDRYGNVEIDSNGYITAFQEKQHCEQGQINGGCYIIQKENNLMNNLPEKFSFETEVIQPNVVEKNVHGFITDGYFIDIGIPEDYQKANLDFAGK